MKRMLLVTSLLWMLAGCGGDSGITKDQAVTIAKERIATDGVMTVDDLERYTLYDEEEARWHIYFPRRLEVDTVWKGGEPHVYVSKSDGSVLDIYYTR